jgi:hypothetical protein
VVVKRLKQYTVFSPKPRLVNFEGLEAWEEGGKPLWGI